ncbi:hypothetical protein [Escherichia coli]
MNRPAELSPPRQTILTQNPGTQRPGGRATPVAPWPALGIPAKDAGM